MPGPQALRRRGGIVDFQLDDGSIVPVAIDHASPELQQLAASVPDAVISPTDRRVISPTDATRPASAVISPTDAAPPTRELRTGGATPEQLWQQLGGQPMGAERMGGAGASAPIADAGRDLMLAPRGDGVDMASPFMQGLGAPPPPAPPATATDAAPTPVTADATPYRFVPDTADTLLNTPFAQQLAGGPQGIEQARTADQLRDQAIAGGDAQGAIGAAQGRIGVVQAPPPAAATQAGAPSDAQVVTVPGARPRGGPVRTPGLSEQQRGYLGTFDAERQSQRTQGDIARGQGRMTADAMQQGINEQDRLAAEAAARENERQQVLARHDRDLAAMRHDLASQRIDDDRYWAEKDTGGRILGAIAAGLGAAGAALTGGPNEALQIMNDAVEQDIQTQRDNLQQRREDYSAAERDRENVLSRFADERMREEARRVAAWDRVERQVRTVAASAAGEQAQAQAQALVAGVDRNRREAEMRFQALNAEAAQRAAAARARASQPRQFVRTQDGLVIEVTPHNALQVQHMLDEGRAHAADGQAPTIPGLEVSDPQVAAGLTNQQRATVTALAGTYGDLSDATDRLLALRREHGAEVFGNPEMEQQQARAMRALSVLEDAGALGDQEREYYRSLIPNAASLDPRTMSRLESLRERVREQGAARFRPYGYQPAAPATATQATSFRAAGD